MEIPLNYEWKSNLMEIPLSYKKARTVSFSGDFNIRLILKKNKSTNSNDAYE